ncbi:Wadjet anti-phage system protein JetD domain-containing protein [Rhodopirellula sp. JC639]|uniref:Wadjet anti-phage system protein JetD domain-containing protein n=1 Tax=Stieleria mannarensis TaxID=2755585 RepID=UPI0016001305|nr:DUF3322 and DUF2220 domain-containing protein [Rhodopirellula sp. JC639]
MITPEAIAEKAKRIYPKAVGAWLSEEIDTFFPHRVPANLSLSKDHAAAIEQVDQLRKASKDVTGRGYTVCYESRRSRTYGLNQFPSAILIDSMDDLVHLAGCQSQWDTLQESVATLRRRKPELWPWLVQRNHWKTLPEIAAVLDGLLDIVDYFQTHPRPDCFARELPLAVSTKLLETHRRRLATWLDIVLPPHTIDHRYGYDAFEPRYGLRYARPHFLIRTLDDQLQSELGLAFDELSLPAESLASLPVADARTLIVENKINLLSLPNMDRSIALGGLGAGVTQLADVEWLHNNPLYYWGDLDAEGFVILDRLRQSLPRVTSVLMDRSILERFQDLATVGNGAQPKELTHLNAEEKACYAAVCKGNLRIEQEHLPIDLLVSILA